MITQTTKLLGVIGQPIGHSKSPLIHNAGILSKKLEYIYLAFEVNDVESAINSMRTLNIRGFSVTIPHKVSVMHFLDGIDPLAKQIGAVNTVVNNNNRLVGYNTDCFGAISALKNKTKLLNKIVYVIGTGGASRAIVAGLVKEKAKVKIYGRDKEKAIKLAQEFNCNYGALQEIDKNYDILVNTTPVGMYPNTNDIPVPEYVLAKGKIVFDIVYNPIETQLQKLAKKKGSKTISGVEMFLEQAYLQFELFTEKKAPKKIMRKVLLKELKKEQRR